MACALIVASLAASSRQSRWTRPAGPGDLGVPKAQLTVVALSAVLLVYLVNLAWLELRSPARDPARLIATAILAAAAKAGLEVMRAGITPHAAQLFGIGLATSAVVGYLTIRFLLRFLAGHSLNGFGYYRLVVAALAAIWLGLR